MSDDKEKVNTFEKDREQGLDRSHSPKNPAEAANVNRSQTIPRNAQGKPAPNGDDAEEEAVETPLTDEAMDEAGDPEAGNYTAKELAEQASPRIIAARDRRAWCIDQALKNEAAHDQVNAKETDIKNEGRKKASVFADMDKIREETLASSLAELEAHTEDGREKRAASRKAIAEARKERGDPSPVPGDISGGSGGGDRPENKG